MKKLSILGAFVGGIVDIVSTNVLAPPLVVIAMTRLDWTHMSKDQVTAAVTTSMQSDLSLMIAGFFVGVAGSLLGGYVAAVIAKHDEALNGAISAWLCVTIGMFGWALGAAKVPVIYHLSAFVLSPAFGALGGYIRVLQKELTSNKHHASG